MPFRWIDIFTRKTGAITYVAACLIGISAALLGWALPIERALDELRAQVTRRDVSGEIVIVEIDGRSLNEVSAWPWPRRIHGQLVDRLREAGARQIVFDIDFTSPAADPEQDRAFAAALARAGNTVVLPGSLEVDDDGGGERIEMLPAPLLRPHVEIGSIWIWMDEDLRVRHVPYSVEIAGERRPSLAAFLAGEPRPVAGSIPIDWAFALRSFRTVSYADVLTNNFEPHLFRGRNVLIGGTALSLGDRWSAPGRGQIPGLFVQAVAAETLRRNDPIVVGAWPALGVVLLLLGAWLRCRRFWSGAAIASGTVAAALLLPPLLREYTPFVVGSAPALAAIAGAFLVRLVFELTVSIVSRVTLTPGTQLPNLTAMRISASTPGAVVAVRLRNHTETMALLGPEAQARLMRKVAARLSLGSFGAEIFQVDDHSFAWASGRRVEELGDSFDGLHALFSSGISVAGRVLDATISVGVCDKEEFDLEAAVAAALLAADQAKQRGSSWLRYEVGHDDAKWRLSLLGEVERAIDNGDIWVAYQPQVSIATGELVGAEALVRWTHPERGDIPPDLFIPMLEENGRIEKLTLHVLRTAILDFAGIDENLCVSVNISMRMIGRGRLLEPIRTMLHQYRMNERRLTLEITESATLAEESGVEELKRLRDLGINISIDDYGTGQSTLTHLKKLPATELKIDRSFVEMIMSSRSDATMVDSTIKLAHALGLTVVAEGVDSEALLPILRSMECDVVQGYHIDRPMPFSAFIARVQRARGVRQSGSGPSAWPIRHGGDFSRRKHVVGM